MRRLALTVSIFMVVGLGLVGGSTATAAPLADAPISSVDSPFVGQKVVLSGSIGTPTVRTIELQSLSKKWSKYASGKTNADGTYSFTASTTASVRQFRVYAKSASGQPSVTSAPIALTTRKDTVSLSIVRVGNSGQARAVASPIIEGRLFTLQYKSGKTWKAASGVVPEAADGTIGVLFALNGAKSYRLVGAKIEGSSGATSSTVAFDPGPKVLGAHAIYVTTDSGKTPTKKGSNYTGSAVIDGGPALAVDTIAVRGNSTATKAKKPYKLKFVEKQKPFGLDKDRTWILLANFQDHSLVRSKVSWDLGAQLDGLAWTPKSVFTELFLNGKYMGSYQLVQSIKIDKNRVDINKETGQIIEFDPHWKADRVPGFKGKSGVNYAWKDPDEYKALEPGDSGYPGADPEGLTKANIDKMTTKIKNFESVLYARDWSKVNFDTLAPESDWTTYLDMKSTVDYYLAREFTKDQDADMFRSNFFSTNNVDPNSPEKFVMGPIWDFDRSAGVPTEKTTIASPTGWWMRGNGSAAHNTNKIHWYTRISKDPRFLTALKARWAEKRLVFKAVSETGVDTAVAQVGVQVAANERARWGSSTSRYKPRASTYAGEISWVKKWYRDRFNWMDGQL